MTFENCNPTTPTKCGKAIPHLAQEFGCLDETAKMLLLQIALKCADLGHVAEEQDVHIKYVQGEVPHCLVRILTTVVLIM